MSAADAVADPPFEPRPGRLRGFVQNADRVVGESVAGVADAGVVADVAAAVVGDPDFFKHTRLFAKFLKARVFFRTTVAETRISEFFWEKRARKGRRERK